MTNCISWADSFWRKKPAKVTECVHLTIATETVSSRQRATNVLTDLKRHTHSLSFILHLLNPSHSFNVTPKWIWGWLWIGLVGLRLASLESMGWQWQSQRGRDASGSLTPLGVLSPLTTVRWWLQDLHRGQHTVLPQNEITQPPRRLTNPL